MNDRYRDGERFVGQAIEPARGALDSRGMVAGEPGLPLRFRWGAREVEVAGVLEKWKTASPCRSGGGERYVRKHWYRIATTEGEEMRIYCDRQSLKGARRWWLFAVRDAEAPESL